MLCLAPSASWARDSAIVIFDGSGSMWGQVDDKPKIVIAREVMGTLLEEWNEDIDIGLMAYGHRKKGSCDDIELMVPVGSPDSEKILAAVDGINPTGKTPISAALQQAARDLRYTEDPATVILISDGEESCGADPCATARSIETSGINFTAHVIGFNIEANEKARTQLKCVAESTGGKFFEAENAAGLKEALAVTAKAVAEPTPPVEPEPVADSGVKLQALPVEGAEPFSQRRDVQFYVYDEAQDIKGKRKPIDRSVEAAPFFLLDAGRYVVAVERGNIWKEVTVEVSAGELTEHIFILDTGNLQLSAIPAEGASAFSKNHDVQFSVFEGKKNLDGKRTRIKLTSDASPIIPLAADSYLIAAKRGNIWKEATVDVIAGELTEYTFNLDTGNLQLNAIPAEGAPAFSKNHEVKFSVFEAQKNLDGKRTIVDQSANASPIFPLASGQYVIAAKRGNTWKEDTVEVTAGQLTEHTFNLDTGNLQLFAAPAEGAPPYAKRREVKFYVLDEKKGMDGKRATVDQSTEAAPIFALAAGRYVVLAEKGDKRQEMAVVVKAGELVEHTLVLPQE